MDTTLYNNIAQSNARRQSRESNAFFVLEHPELADDLITLALDVSNKHHFKACWILEIVLEHDLTLLFPRLSEFCDALPGFTNDSALRSIAKICVFCNDAAVRDKDCLSQKQLLQIAESCFAWIISDEKVATKAYAIKALYNAGKQLDWIYPELAAVLERGFAEHSGAYKSIARNVLKKIRR